MNVDELEIGLLEHLPEHSRSHLNTTDYDAKVKFRVDEGILSPDLTYSELQFYSTKTSDFSNVKFSLSKQFWNEARFSSSVAAGMDLVQGRTPSSFYSVQLMKGRTSLLTRLRFHSKSYTPPDVKKHPVSDTDSSHVYDADGGVRDSYDGFSSVIGLFRDQLNKLGLESTVLDNTSDVINRFDISERTVQINDEINVIVSDKSMRLHAGPTEAYEDLDEERLEEKLARVGRIVTAGARTDRILHRYS